MSNRAASLPSAPLAPESELPAGCPVPIRDLVAGLAGAGVRYCHWKSNIRLAESLAGEEDLDLLIHRADAASFLSVLVESGFKLAHSASGIDHPGVFHAFALDRGRLLHVHAYFQVVTGDSLAKSYHLPIENDLLTNTRTWMGVPTSVPELELPLFALRMMLKHTGPVEIAMVSRGYAGIVRELEWLTASADRCAAAGFWGSWIPGAMPEDFDRALAAMGDPTAVLQRVKCGLRLARRLKGRRRIGAVAGTASRWRRIAVLATGRIRHRRDFVLSNGGAIIALVGPKASGKSTLCSELSRRLGRHLTVRRVHAGKPPPTLLTALPRLLTPLARALFPRERTGEYEKPARRHEGGYSLLYVLRMVLLAYDRRALIRRCWRDAASGTIVITDRYPSGTVGAMDSGRFDAAAIAACHSPLKRWLMRREQTLSGDVPLPDLVIRLTVRPETAVCRDALRSKAGGPDADAVLRRWDMETSGDFGGAPVIAVDTEHDLAETTTALLNRIWAEI